MALLSRLLTGPIGFYDEPIADSPFEAKIADSPFEAKVEFALSRGWTLSGSPAITFNPKEGVVWAAQTVEMVTDGLYTGFIGLKDVPPAKGSGQTTDYYRIIVGGDDSKLCAYIEQKLNDGWKHHGSPVLTYGFHVIAAQAITRRDAKPYDKFIPTAEIEPRPQVLKGAAKGTKLVNEG